MAYYYEGYSEARRSLESADLKDLLQFIDAIFGRDDIEDENDIEEVRREALRQCKEEFTDRSSSEFSTRLLADVNFWTSVIKADKRH